ncbi:hypothetical protein DOE62_08125 [Salmonella enterica subsp. enterica serovar Brandenburg]|uniref:cytochrome c biogenesis protein CcsA n=1 Tax=Salmonella enterica TaxID=28901 RepID=UPI000DEDDD46|nr:cytochrome c biogenesis protein CcsA [Salmonella enterica]AXC90133.1 hypothetical protein DOE62_08125 [Salmonella enterica subsp. enterica serovar Brandenburg]
MMASAGVRPAAVYLHGGAFFVLVHALWLTTSPWPMSPATRTRSCRWYRVAAARGSRRLAAAVGAADERLDLAVVVFSRRVPADIVARVLAVMGMVCAGFLVFILFTSGPFARTLPAPSGGGARPEPAAAGPGLIFHPPLLYMGYVGFSVAFAFAIAALLSGRLDSAFARFARPWTLAAWVFLTLGIVLGSAGLLRSWLGRLVVLGPGGERLLYAVAGWAPPAALAGGHGTACRF